MTTICPDMEQAALSVPAQLLHRLIVRETLHGAEYPLVVHPPLEMPRDGRRRWPLIDHHRSTVHIDPEASTEERIRAWIEQLGNPYVYLDGGVVVKLSFADKGETIEERINSLYLAGA